MPRSVPRRWDHGRMTVKHKLMVMLALGVGFLLMVPHASVAQTGLEEQGT